MEDFRQENLKSDETALIFFKTIPDYERVVSIPSITCNSLKLLSVYPVCKLENQNRRMSLEPLLRCSLSVTNDLDQI